MGSITQQQGGVAGTLAARNRALNTPAGQAAPLIADLVGSVGGNLRNRDAALDPTADGARRLTAAALTTPGGGGPTISDIVYGVGHDAFQLVPGQSVIAGRSGFTPLSAYAPAAAASPAAPRPVPTAGLGNLMQSIQQAQSTAAPALNSAPDIAALIRQVRQLQGF